MSSTNQQDQLSLQNIHRCPMFSDQQLVDNILDEEKEQKVILEQKSAAVENKKRRCSGNDICRVVLLTALVIFVCAVTFLESKNLKAYIQWISDQTEYYVNSESVVSYLVFLAFQIAFHLLFVPGLTFFDVLVGFYMKDTLKAFLIVYSTSLISCMLTFYVARFLFKDYFERTIFKKDIFAHMLSLSKSSPWKASSITRYHLA
jgi:hypothetical protein